MNTLNATQLAKLTQLGAVLFGHEGNAAGLALELAYAQVLGWRHCGGTMDKGVDVVDPQTRRGVQVKSSLKGAQEFLRKCTKKRKFIPVCIGKPGTKDEILDSLVKYGAWIDHKTRAEVPYYLEAVARRRARVLGWPQELSSVTK